MSEQPIATASVGLSADEAAALIKFADEPGQYTDNNPLRAVLLRVRNSMGPPGEPPWVVVERAKKRRHTLLLVFLGIVGAANLLNAGMQFVRLWGAR